MKHVCWFFLLLFCANTSSAQAPCSQNCVVEVNKPFTVLFEAPPDGSPTRLYLNNVKIGADLPAGTGTISIPNISVSSVGDHVLRVASFAGDVETSTPDLKLIASNPAPPPDTTAPTAPQQLAGVPTTNSVVLTWGAASDAVGVVGYRVSRNGAEIGAPAGLTFTDSGLSPSTPYVYAVTAVDAAGNISVPATTTVQTPPVTSQPCVANGKPYSIIVAVQAYTKQLGLGARGRVDFTLANSFPVTQVQVKLGAQVVGEITGADLRDVGGIYFSVPRTAGTYTLFLTGRDNTGCVTSTTTVRPLVVQ